MKIRMMNSLKTRAKRIDLLWAMFISLFVMNSSHGAIEEVVVSAQKRNENNQNVPIAVTSFSASLWENMGLSKITDISEFTPNVEMDFTAPFSGSTQVLSAYIRGIGQSDFAFNLEPGVGVYVDGVYFARNVGAVFDLLDLDHVEILKGPQGTLFGRNTIGGAINIITRPPAEYFSYKGEITTGKYNRVDIRASVDAPLIPETLYSQISISSKIRNGYHQRLPYPTDNEYITDTDLFMHADDATRGDQGGEETLNIRSKILWVLPEDTEVLFSFDYVKINDKAQPSTLLAVDGGDNTLVGLYNDCVGVPVVLDSGPCGGRTGPNNSDLSSLSGSNNRLFYDNGFVTGDIDSTYADGPNFSQVDSWGGASTITKNITENTKFKSITAFRDLKSEFGSSGDGAPLAIVDQSFAMNQQQVSQEFQFSGVTLGEDLNWLLGLYYFVEEGDLTDFVVLGEGLQQIFGRNEFETDASALFANIDYALTQRLSLLGGIRFTHEHKQFVGLQRDLNSFSSKTGLPPILHPNPDDLTLYYPQGINRRDFNNTSIKTGVMYDLSDNAMSYLTYSEGFKSGGWSTRLTTAALEAPEFDEETAATTELGLKSEFFNNELRTNVALFFTNYDDLQISVNEGNSVFIRNAAKSTIKGVEFELEAALTESLLITANLGYVDARYNELDANVVNIDKDNLFVNTPKWKYSIAADFMSYYGFGSIRYHIDFIQKDKVANDIGNTLLLIQDKYSVLNLNIGYEAPSHTWELAVGGHNITNERYIVSGTFNPNIGITEAAYSRPVEWYLSFKYYNL